MITGEDKVFRMPSRDPSDAGRQASNGRRVQLVVSVCLVWEYGLACGFRKRRDRCLLIFAQGQIVSMILAP